MRMTRWPRGIAWGMPTRSLHWPARRAGAGQVGMILLAPPGNHTSADVVDQSCGLHVGWEMAVPTNLKPRSFSALLEASDSGVCVGTSDMIRGRLTSG